METNSFEKLVHDRHSVRVFDKTSVPEDVIQKCLDLALQAPNSSNLQPWEFHWVRDGAKKTKMVDACLSQAAAATAAELIVCVARTDTWQSARTDILAQLAEKEKAGVKIPGGVWNYYRKLVPVVYPQGWFGLLGLLKKIIFFIIGFQRAVPREPTSLSDLKIWAIKSTALACENIMLAAKSFGYDSCPMEGFDSARVRRILKLNRSSSVVMVIAIGKAAANSGALPRIRGPRSKSVIIH